MNNFEIIDFENDRSSNQKRIDTILSEGYNFDFSKYLEEGFKLANKDIGISIGFTLLFFAISFITLLIPFIGAIAYSFFLFPVLTAGYFFYYDNLSSNRSSNFNIFFNGFKSPFIGKLISANAIKIGFMFILLIPFVLYFIYNVTEMIKSIQENNYNQLFDVYIETIILAIFMYVPILMVAVTLVLSIPTVIFYKHSNSVWESVNGARKIVSKKWFHFLGILFLLSIFNMIGSFLCGIGLLYTIPLSYSVIYCAFKDIFSDNQTTNYDF